MADACPVDASLKAERLRPARQRSLSSQSHSLDSNTWVGPTTTGNSMSHDADAFGEEVEDVTVHVFNATGGSTQALACEVPERSVMPGGSPSLVAMERNDIVADGAVHSFHAAVSMRRLASSPASGAARRSSSPNACAICHRVPRCRATSRRAIDPANGAATASVGLLQAQGPVRSLGVCSIDALQAHGKAAAI